MKLSFNKTYKSLSFFPEMELPDFVVLTGVNGAGKSHLLEAIDNGSVQIDDISAFGNQKLIRRFDWINLFPQDTPLLSPYEISQEKQSLWNDLSVSVSITNVRPLYTALLRQHDRLDLDSCKIRDLIDVTQEYLIESGSTITQANDILEGIQRVTSDTNQAVKDRFVSTDPFNRSHLIELLNNTTNVPLIAMEPQDFNRYFPRQWQRIIPFQQSFARLFVDYRQIWLENQLKMLASFKGRLTIFLTEEEFVEKYGEAPWIFVNSILEAAQLDFRINEPSEYGNDSYEPILTDETRGSQVRFADLSSGEKILMSFALCLYYSQDRRQIVDYPKILLFDEIDAPLHPSMTQSLLRAIQGVLIDRYRIKVILTTHSPSTVALSPEDSLYVMYKDEKKRIQKTTKDKALAILTTGVPTLSIDYENRRQVFVESNNDVQFYDPIYKKLRDRLTPEISLCFIASGAGGQGNSDQVREVVNKLANGGNRTVYGVVDWDLKNYGNERVKVLGCEQRYSIENYILDPVLVAAFLLREKWVSRDVLGLTEHETYLSIACCDNTRLQFIADFIVNKVKASIAIESEGDNLPCEYVGGHLIALPKWFLHIQGHNLEEELKKVFPQLKRFKKEVELKLEIISKVIDDVPDLIPIDFLQLFKAIQKVA